MGTAVHQRAANCVLTLILFAIIFYLYSALILLLMFSVSPSPANLFIVAAIEEAKRGGVYGY